MRNKSFLGEFEQMVLLAILRLGDDAYALNARGELDRTAGRKVSRGAFYTTLDRLTGKGYLEWTVEAPTAERGGMPLRRFKVTESGVVALKASKNALGALWHGLEEVLG